MIDRSIARTFKDSDPMIDPMIAAGSVEHPCSQLLG